METAYISQITDSTIVPIMNAKLRQMYGITTNEEFIFTPTIATTPKYNLPRNAVNVKNITSLATLGHTSKYIQKYFCIYKYVSAITNVRNNPNISTISNIFAEQFIYDNIDNLDIIIYLYLITEFHQVELSEHIVTLKECYTMATEYAKLTQLFIKKLTDTKGTNPYDNLKDTDMIFGAI